jgi:hypothetical protein
MRERRRVTCERGALRKTLTARYRGMITTDAWGHQRKFFGAIDD